MSTVTLTLTTLTTPLPAGVTAGLINVSLTDNATGTVFGTQAVADTNGITATFTAVPDGVYTASAQLVDSTGAALGAAVTVPVTVATAPTTFEAPTGMTVTVTP
jgi:hypothetical protein